MDYDVIVIGAGAAGLMCARVAGSRGRRVAVLEHSPRLGLKILVSGGGRCNFTHLDTRPEDFQSSNPHFFKSALARFTPQDFLKLVEAHGIKYHHKTPGQLFCDHSSREIVAMLAEECRRAKADITLDTKILSVAKSETGFTTMTSRGEFKSASLVVATGGLSWPKLGATGLGYDLARQFGHDIVTPEPALDGFLFPEAERAAFSALAGVTLNARVTTAKRDFTDGLVFTHVGVSGPAALNASLYWRAGTAVEICFAPEVKLGERLLALKKDQPRLTLKNALQNPFSENFVKTVASHRGVELEGRLADLTDKKLTSAADALQKLRFVPPATVGYEKAEVTRGGVSTRKISSQTMESQLVPGLYFVGEVVDVTGRLGGYNFQWAWASGHAAGGVC